ncbi:unnamed protein product, partial [marine sediment metagenome]
GKGTRLSEETYAKPKPMVEIGGRPILWHIMKIYSHHGFNEFVICLGYLGHMIKEYFANYALYTSDVTFDLSNYHVTMHRATSEPWKVTLVDTGLESGTAERILAVEPYLDETFMLTYGDGVANIDIEKLRSFHLNHRKLVTMSVTKPDNKLGVVVTNKDGLVTSFREKPPSDGWSNCGFFVFKREALGLLQGHRDLEGDPLTKLLQNRELMAYQHDGYWQCMDTLREKRILEEQWATGKAPWRVW